MVTKSDPRLSILTQDALTFFKQERRRQSLHGATGDKPYFAIELALWQKLVSPAAAER
jgi:hypothetical protein